MCVCQTERFISRRSSIEYISIGNWLSPVRVAMPQRMPSAQRHNLLIVKTHTIKDKATGGFLWDQNIVFLLLVTDKLTLPVGFLSKIHYRFNTATRIFIAQL